MGWAYQQVATLSAPELSTLTVRRRLALLCATATATKHHATAAYNTYISGAHCPSPVIDHLRARAGQC